MIKRKMVELVLAENKTDKRLKAWMFDEDKNLMKGILKRNFKVIREKEVMK